MGGYAAFSSFGEGKKLVWANTGEAIPSKANSGVMGEGVCMAPESEESEELLRTSRGVGGEPTGDDV